MAKKFSKAFFLRPAHKVAPDLLGAKLSTRVNGVSTSAMIVEVEAYGEAQDQASHAYIGPTKRNEVMFQEGGLCYVYLIYGMHYCVNVVTDKKGLGSAVLIRAVKPISGTAQMRKRRKVAKELELTNGPSKLCQALRIDKAFWGEDLRNSKRIRLTAFRSFKRSQIACSKRVGISKSKHLKRRYYLRGCPWVSKG